MCGDIKIMLDWFIEDKWCKGWYAKDAKGKNVNADSPAAVKWCILGAFYKEKLDTTAFIHFYKKLDPIYSAIGDFNDTSDWETVRKLIDNFAKSQEKSKK